MSSILVENLSMNDALLKFTLLNKNFFQIMEKMKTFPNIWKIKFVQEFTNDKDKREKTYASPSE
jgi:hypothetical protein